MVKSSLLDHDRLVFVFGNTLLTFAINYYLLLETTSNTNNYSKLDGVMVGERRRRQQYQ